MDIRPLITSDVLRSVRASLARIVKDNDLLDDIVQTAVVRALASGKFDGRNIGAWLHTIAYRIFLSEMRRQKRWASLVSPMNDFSLLASIPSHEAQVFARIELKQAQQYAFFDLANIQRAVMLAALSGDEVDEISERYGKSRKWVTSSMNKARTRLREFQEWRD